MHTAATSNGRIKPSCYQPPISNQNINSKILKAALFALLCEQCTAKQTQQGLCTPGQVAFFDQPNCPEGWEIWEKVAAETNQSIIIRGTGTAGLVGEQGGEKNPRLKPSNIPDHSHKISAENPNKAGGRFLSYEDPGETGYHLEPTNIIPNTFDSGSCCGPSPDPIPAHQYISLLACQCKQSGEAVLEKVNELETEVNILASNGTKTSKNVEDLREQLQALSKNGTKITGEVEALEQQLEALSNNSTDNTHAIKGLKDSMETLLSNMTQIFSEIEKLKESINNKGTNSSTLDYAAATLSGLATLMGLGALIKVFCFSASRQPKRKPDKTTNIPLSGYGTHATPDSVTCYPLINSDTESTPLLEEGAKLKEGFDGSDPSQAHEAFFSPTDLTLLSPHLETHEPSSSATACRSYQEEGRTQKNTEASSSQNASQADEQKKKGGTESD